LQLVTLGLTLKQFRGPAITVTAILEHESCNEKNDSEKDHGGYSVVGDDEPARAMPGAFPWNSSAVNDSPLRTPSTAV
jgi:hypothetical protein